MLPPSKHIKSRTALIRQLLLFVLLSLVSVSVAQGGFKKKYFLQGSLTSACANAIETPNGNIMSIGVTVDTIFGQQIQRLTLLGTDPQGNQLWKKSYGTANLWYYGNIEQPYTDSTGFYQAVILQDLGVRTLGGLIKFNFQGDTIWQKLYRDSNPLDDLVPTSIARSEDGGFLITGYFQIWGTAGYRKLLIIKTDQNGNELWRKKLSGTSANWQKVLWGYGITQDNASKKILISCFQYLGTPNSYYGYGCVVCTDSLGNSLWQKAFLNMSSGPLSSITKLSDGNFIAVGQSTARYDMWGGALRSNCAAVKFDINGNQIWNKTYDSEGVSNRLAFSSELPNNKILLIGIVDSSYMHNRNGSPAITAITINTNGDLLNSKIVGSSQENVFGTAEGPKSLYACKDKGFVLATFFPDAPNPQPYSILKIDSTYCDTLEAYCRAVEVGLPQFNLPSVQIELYPNPANDHIFVKCLQTSQNNLSIKILDLSGRLVLQRNVFSDETSIDLSALASGLYQVSVLQNEHLIETKKLVLER